MDRKDQLFFLKNPSKKARLAYLEKKIGKIKISYKDLSRRYYSYLLTLIRQPHLITLLKKKQNLELLEQMDDFFALIGGLMGYQIKIEALLHPTKKKVKIDHPELFDLQNNEAWRKRAFVSAIDHLDKLCEVYPIGGAGDRLGFFDLKTKKAMPAALLPFHGKTLLERILQDLQTKEYLYYKLHKKRIDIPIVFMTSKEKKNHQLILNSLKKMQLPLTSVIFLQQPVVSVVDTKGTWQIKEGIIVTKPGGHGMLWRLLEQNQVLQKLEKKGVRSAIIRQINNPLAGSMDHLYLLFEKGYQESKTFGFFSCPRMVQAAEGMIVTKIVQQKRAMTNVEYTDFQQYGIQDVPEKKGSNTSVYPANTNLLYFDLKKIKPYIKKTPFPGALLNFKGKKYARLELTMQNIADSIEVNHKSPSFCLHTARERILSPVKKRFVKGKDPFETPVGAFMELSYYRAELLASIAKAPRVSKNAIPFLFSFHPALGPTKQIIEQKITSLTITKNSKLQIDIPTTFIKKVKLTGTLQILRGKKEKVKGAMYLESGRVWLENIDIRLNVKKLQFEKLAKIEVMKEEGVTIVVEGNGQFVAKDLQITKPITIRVPDQTMVIAKQEGRKIIFEKRKLKKPQWSYQYKRVKDEITVATVF